jgi:hypothetical protein
MQVGHQLEFDCLKCRQPLHFSVLNVQTLDKPLICSHCQKAYQFDEPKLLRQLKQFEALCREIHKSEEILGETAIAINVGPHEVQFPYKLLLTRFNSTLKLNIEGQSVTIVFRIEPLKDVKEMRQLKEVQRA